MKNIHEVLERQFLPREIRELYRGKRTTFYADLKEVKPGVKASHQKAANDFLFLSDLAYLRGESLIAAGFGPMASGKSTAICLMKYERPQAQTFKHILDLELRGPNITNSNGDKSIRVPAKHYSGVENILEQLGPEKLLLVDEIEFAKNNFQEIVEFVQELRRRQVHAFLSGLDLDFRRQTWPVTETILSQADHVFVLAAQCTEPGCSRPAPFTQRTINGEPAHFDDPVVMVGDVTQFYHPKCPRHHQVLPPRGNLTPCFSSRSG